MLPLNQTPSSNSALTFEPTTRSACVISNSFWCCGRVLSAPMSAVAADSRRRVLRPRPMAGFANCSAATSMLFRFRDIEAFVRAGQTSRIAAESMSATGTGSIRPVAASAGAAVGTTTPAALPPASALMSRLSVATGKPLTASESTSIALDASESSSLPSPASLTTRELESASVVAMLASFRLVSPPPPAAAGAAFKSRRLELPPVPQKVLRPPFPATAAAAAAASAARPPSAAAESGSVPAVLIRSCGRRSRSSFVSSDPDPAL